MLGFNSKKKVLVTISVAVFNVLSVFGIKAQDTILVNQNSVDTINIQELKKLFFNSNDMSCWGSRKVDSLVRLSNSEKSKWNRNISSKHFASLDAFQHFVYAFNYPEYYNQSCSIYSLPTVLETMNHIPGNLLPEGEGYEMSSRQLAAVLGNRDSTITLIKGCIDEYQEVQNSFKKLIVDNNLFELVPSLISTIQNQKFKDPYILTTLTLLMHKSQFLPFTKDYISKRLYPSSYDTIPYYLRKERSIVFSEQNYKSILKMANEYFVWKKSSEDKFVKINSGTYIMGKPGHSVNPRRFIHINEFEISKYEITNAEFSEFIQATGYITDAEKNKNAMVFLPGLDEFKWILDTTASWRFPSGNFEGGIDQKMNHPVSCISYSDAQAYCNWAGVNLPTNEQWEAAARGRSYTMYFFEDTSLLIHDFANIWQAENHSEPSLTDKYVFTSPVGEFKPNPFGLYDIYGNVFEFCSDKPMFFNELSDIATTRGGSWWCSINTCNFFNSVDIGRVQIHASFSNNGFRVVK